jgi:6-methylsalicylate decarboxylase
MSVRPGRIDVHFHMIPQFFREAAEAAGRRPAISSGLPSWTPELALGLMERSAIATAITSVSAPGVHFGDDLAAKNLARQCNEYAADLAREWPGRFGGFAVLPLPHIDYSLEEVRYALDTLQLDGVLLFANCQGRYLGDPQFDPLLEELNRRNCIVFVHPAPHPANASIGVDLPQFVVEYVFDTTRAATNMIFAQTLTRFPNIRFILAHAGGTLPYIAWRIAHSPQIDPKRFGAVTPATILAQIRHFWFDTALSPTAQAFAGVRNVTDDSHILFGSDWPYAPEPLTHAAISAIEDEPSIDDAFKDAITCGNARGLFSRFH